jgi:BlaI family penicillinase repressor
MSGPELKSISKAEFVVMECIWKHSKLDSKGLASVLDGKVDWHENTIRTLLLRLVKKGFVSRENIGRSFRYRAVIPRSTYVSQRIQICTDELFEGNSARLLETIISNAFISESDIRNLMTVLDQKQGRLLRSSLTRVAMRQK